MGEINDCLKRFSHRRELFQTAVHAQLKLKKLEADIDASQSSSPSHSTLKEVERAKKKLSQHKQEFKGLNSVLQQDVESLLNRVRPMTAQILATFIRSQRLLYTKVGGIPNTLIDAENKLIGLSGESNDLFSSSPNLSLSLGTVTSPLNETATKKMTKSSRFFSMGSPTSNGMAQVFLLTARKTGLRDDNAKRDHKPTDESLLLSGDSTDDMTPGGVGMEVVSPPSHPRESDSIPSFTSGCGLVPMLNLSGDSSRARGNSTPTSSRLVSAVLDETGTTRK
eukprot:Blabericola_migrator_1__520@NODE_1128_length_5346_cov_67_075014_g307_i2_p3_GENE_NODE_1128_length_5346_cov_67_075014_g307_i2NODE_1128_length_5346_cov_67_075014_g307_i2_p3_ORF_typecomplete_len280_score58_37BAR/PF03114_18/1_4e06Vps5/PF09325_10/0_00013DUF2433/PF10360_9/0_096YfdX/PF10938_8/0_14_NODE_1128_length_5346_cov_67_075014_g307_i233064145